MKTKRTLLFRMGTVVLLIVIAAVMIVIGRGHTVYFDNNTLEYDGKTYATPYKAVIIVDDEQIAKLYDDERGMTTCIGQTLNLTFEITQEKGGSKEVITVALPLPYHMDGIAINLPAYLAGLPEEVYLSEFKIVPTPEEDDSSTDETPTDEFDLGDV